MRPNPVAGREWSKIALTNVRVFDGTALRPPDTVVVDGARFGVDAQGAEVIDGGGAVLLPGLIDAHVHFAGPRDLEELHRHGVTTAFDMACWIPGLIESLRDRTGMTDVRSAGVPAVARGAAHTGIPGFPEECALNGVDDAAPFVAARVAEGSDHIKVIADEPGLDQDTMSALVAEAHRHARLAVTHAVRLDSVRMALTAHTDVLTHVPFDRPIGQEEIDVLRAYGGVAVPTLTMMEAIVEQGRVPGADYRVPRESVVALVRAEIPVLAGTDANSTPGVPASVPHGASIHRELELLVDAGMSTVDALRAATEWPAGVFGLRDRGAVEPGKRADLVLVDGDPLADITATRSVREVWCAGVRSVVA